MKKRILPILLALIMVLTLLPTLALADGEKVLIDGNNKVFTSLEAAVKAANPGNTIYVYPGNYDIVPDNSTYVEGQTGWYLAITKSLTIMGVDADGDPITDAADACANIYSTYYTANGAHASQDLIYVNADDVTISGLNIMNKYEANKAIELRQITLRSAPATLCPSLRNCSRKVALVPILMMSGKTMVPPCISMEAAPALLWRTITSIVLA